MGLYYSRLCLQASVLSHIVRRNIALQRLARAISPFLQVPGEPPALPGSIQDLELVARAEAKVLCGPSLVVKQSHKVVAVASPGLLTLQLGRTGGAAGHGVLNHHSWLVSLLKQAGETGPQVCPESQTNVAHGAVVGGGERGFSLSPQGLQINFLFFHQAAWKSAPIPWASESVQSPVSQRGADLPAVIPAWGHSPGCFLWLELLPQYQTEWELGGCSGEDVLSSSLLRNPRAKMKSRGLHLDKCLRTEESSCFMSRGEVSKRKR